MKSNKISVLFVIAAGILWGSSCLFVDTLTEWGFSPVQCTAIRVFMAALILNATLLIGGFKNYRISGWSWLMCAVTGICSVLSMSLFYYACMVETSAAVSAILLYTAPIFVMIMSVIFFRERVTLKKVAAFVIAIVGCALVSGVASGITLNAKGLIFGILSGFTYSLYGILTTFYMKKNTNRLTFAALNFLFATLGVIAISDPIDIVRKVAATDSLLKTLGFFVLFGICTAVFPFLLYTLGLSGVRPDVASILAFSEPLTAAVFGIVVLKQPFDKYQGIGIALVTAAIVILNITFKKRAENRESTKTQ